MESEQKWLSGEKDGIFTLPSNRIFKQKKFEGSEESAGKADRSSLNSLEEVPDATRSACSASSQCEAQD